MTFKSCYNFSKSNWKQPLYCLAGLVYWFYMVSFCLLHGKLKINRTTDASISPLFLPKFGRKCIKGIWRTFVDFGKKPRLFSGCQICQFFKGIFFRYVDKILTFLDHLLILVWHFWRNSLTIIRKKFTYCWYFQHHLPTSSSQRSL